MAKFDKTLLQSYILTNCKRRLFLELGRTKPELWFNPVRPVPTEPPERLAFQKKILEEKGREYEQQVYSFIKKVDNAVFKEGANGSIAGSDFSKENLKRFYDLLLKSPDQTLMLLEYQYEIPISFFNRIFPLKVSVKEIPVLFSEQRPDIMFVGNRINEFLSEGVYEILSDGTIQVVPQSQLGVRFGISIFDIKFVKDDNVSKKHFIEIFYYLKTLALFLKENGLQEKFYVRANFNGIFPYYEGKELSQITSIDDLFRLNLVNVISWKEANRIFNRVTDVIRRLWIKSPCPIESVKNNIHQGCGYCQYIEDCKITLGKKEGIPPKEWSLKLIPFTSQSIAQQLIEEYKFNTIGDVMDNLDTIQVKSIPKPIYSELPTLKLKAEALINDRIIYPQIGQTQSYAIPRYSPIALNFDVEYDRNNDRIFAVGIFLSMFISSRLNYHAIFDNWWRIWKTAFNENKSSEEICDELNEYLIREIPLEIVKRFLYCLEKLKAVEIKLREENSNKGTEVIYKFSSVNEDITPESEAKLTINTIQRLNLILDMCNIIEEYIVIDSFKPGIYFGPDTSIFYWSKSQLENFQNMLQRNLDFVINDKKAREAYESILMYFTPTDAEVRHPLQHKKMFDVQSFAESLIGFPDIINYTWHGMGKKLFNLKINPKFWVPHFNFLDLANWLAFLFEKDLTKKEKLKKQIKNQLILKLKTINSIRYRFQKEGSLSLSRNARVISKSDYSSAFLPSTYHDLSHVWYLFSRLNSALEQQDDEYYRTMFPEFSIGKLFSARIKNLHIQNIGEKNQYYTFDIIELSSNMKLKEGDNVLLIPNDKRGLNLDKRIYKWIINIERITWDPSINGNHIVTNPTNTNFFEVCEAEDIDPKQQEWYIYPLSTDTWSNKLHNNNDDGLLERENFGMSWLGFRLAFLWKVRTDPKLKWPKLWEFTTPSIYLFAPELLSKFTTPFLNDKLLTTVYPTPDPSQEQAIKNSLTCVISAILGPPGTGKSQTIAALIDEYVMQNKKRNKPTKILVTSFSYAALKVVLEKIRISKDIKGDPTASARMQMVFVRSETQEPIPPIKGGRDVEDLARRGTTWKLNGKSRSVIRSKLLEESLEDSFVIFANAHHLYYLKDRVSDDFAFDLICVDEASQLPTDYFMASLQFIYKSKFKIKRPDNLDVSSDEEIVDKKVVESLEIETNEKPPGDLTKVVIVGDHNQLPPVRIKNPPKNLEMILDSLFRYYVDGHKISSKQLKINYRSHEDVVNFTSLLGLYEDLKAFELNAKSTLKGAYETIKEPWIKEVLDPKKVVCAIIHNQKFEIGISVFEAEIVSKIIANYYDMLEPKTEQEEFKFWTEKVGVVAPHNAQGRTIIRKLFDEFSERSLLPKPNLMELLKSTIYSVEKFQGSDRDLIVTSIGLSDEDKINAEEEFIFNLNRFNVLTSRAKNKIIFISSNKFLRYIPENRKVLENASKIYMFVEEFCNKEIALEIKSESDVKETVRFRYKE